MNLHTAVVSTVCIYLYNCKGVATFSVSVLELYEPCCHAGFMRVAQTVNMIWFINKKITTQQQQQQQRTTQQASYLLGRSRNRCCSLSCSGGSRIAPQPSRGGRSGGGWRQHQECEPSDCSSCPRSTALACTPQVW